MLRRSLFAGGVLLILVLMTTVLTWPQARYLTSHVAAHNDPNFSMWRLGWIAHALATDPVHLFDGNIFYPSPRTLAYSDATLLEGLLSAPLIWAHVSPTIVYNLMLLGGIAVSGLGMFVLARHLTGSVGAGLVAATVFTMAPYRLEHFMHLELQWTMWVPLALWAIHRAFEEPGWKWGALAGLFLSLQMISCVYYGVFLAMIMVALVVLLAIARGARARTAVLGLIVGALIAAVLIGLYMLPYVENTKTLSLRNADEISRYSATPINYLASPPQNWLWGWTADRFGDNETRLFPGLGAVVLAIAAFGFRPRRLVWIYLALCALAVEFSFGTHGWLSGWLHAHVPALHGLRAFARFAILAQCMLAVLAAFGFSVVVTWLRPAPRASFALIAGVLMLLMVEYAPARMYLIHVANEPPDVYKVIRGSGPGVVAELPMPLPDGLPAWDAIYESWSIYHWHPLVNGYSGYYPPDYMKTLEIMRTFPDDESIARLAELNVRFIVVHRELYPHDEYASMLDRMSKRRELFPWGHYADPVDEAQLFELRR